MQMRRGPTPAARTRRNAPRGPGRSAERCAGSGGRSGCAAGNANRKCASDERAVVQRYLQGRVIRRHMGGDRFTPGFAFMLAGLAILFVSGAFEAEVVLTQSLQTPGYQGTTDLVRLSAVPWGLGLLFFGYAIDHPEVLWDRVRSRRILAAFLLFADGGIHILAIGSTSIRSRWHSSSSSCRSSSSAASRSCGHRGPPYGRGSSRRSGSSACTFSRGSSSSRSSANSTSSGHSASSRKESKPFLRFHSPRSS